MTLYRPKHRLGPATHEIFAVDGSSGAVRLRKLDTKVAELGWFMPRDLGLLWIPEVGPDSWVDTTHLKTVELEATEELIEVLGPHGKGYAGVVSGGHLVKED